MARAFRAALCPRRRAGRKADEATERAAELFSLGMKAYTGARTRALVRAYQRRLWQRIYREVYPELAAEDRLTRQYRTGALRRNVKSLLRRRGANTRRRLVSPHKRARVNV